MGMNQGWGLMSMVVSERGRGTWLVHESEVICVDPGEQVEAQMAYYGLSLSCLKGVLLTTSSSLNCLELILKLPRLAIIIEEKLYSELVHSISSQTCLPEETLKSTLRGKVIREAQSTDG